MLCNAYGDMSSFSARSKHQRCYTQASLSQNNRPTLTYERTRSAKRRHPHRDVAAVSDHDGGHPVSTATPFQ